MEAGLIPRFIQRNQSCKEKRNNPMEALVKRFHGVTFA